jgi:hypothetical protein
MPFTAAAICALAVLANPGPPPNPAVGIGRVTDFLLRLGPLTPKLFYPEGKLSDLAAHQALDLAFTAMSGQDADAWLAATVKPTGRVGIQADCTWPQVSMVLVDVLIDRIVHIGVAPSQIYVYAGDEREIYRAGLLVKREGDGVRVVGTASEGFRNGVSRVALDYCDVLINVARLKPDRRIGLWGCTANNLSLVDYPDRLAALAEPDKLCDIAARPTVRAKTKVCLLDALQPPYEPAVEHGDVRLVPPRWPYGGVIASADPIAADIVGWRLIEAYRAGRKLEPAALSPRPDYLEKACGEHHLSRALEAGPPVVIRGNQADALVP